jgi:hypothetical protein
MTMMMEVMTVIVMTVTTILFNVPTTTTPTTKSHSVPPSFSPDPLPPHLHPRA